MAWVLTVIARPPLPLPLTPLTPLPPLVLPAAAAAGSRTMSCLTSLRMVLAAMCRSLHTPAIIRLLASRKRGCGTARVVAQQVVLLHRAQVRVGESRVVREHGLVLTMAFQRENFFAGGVLAGMASNTADGLVDVRRL